MTSWARGAARAVVVGLSVLGLAPAGAAWAQTALSQAAAPAAVPVRPEYRLRPGDGIEIKLYFHPDLNQEATIRPDGRISFPLIADVQAEGRTPAELASALSEALGAELRNPTAAVIVTRFAEQRVYIGGEVGQPGAIQLAGLTTVLQAVMQAGGLRKSARPAKTVVLRAVDATHTDVILLDLRLPKGEPTDDQRQALAFTLQPLDVVFVPKSRIASATDFVEQYVTKLVPIQYILGIQFYPFGVPLPK